MKNIVFIIVFLISCILFAQSSVVTSDPTSSGTNSSAGTRFYGRLFSLFQWYQLPTSEKDKMEFMSPGLQLNGRWISEGHTAAGFRAEFGKARNPSDGEQTAQLKEAFLQWNQQKWSFQWGAIADYFTEEQNRRFDFYYLSNLSEPLTQRFNYIYESDKGISLTKKGTNAIFSISLRNGEGLAGSEQGFRKDFSLYFEYLFQNGSFISNLVAGGYDGFSAEASRKYRGIFGLSWEPNSSVRIQYLYYLLNDPVDSFPIFKQADGIDLAAYGGDMAMGIGHEFKGIFIKDKAETGSTYFFWDAKALKPMKEAEATLWSIFLGFGYDIEKNLQVGLSLGSLHYSEDYSLSVEDQGQVGVGFKFTF